MYEFPKGQFTNCFYSYANRVLKEPDKIIMVSKNENGEKIASVVEKPEYYFYVTKDIAKQNNKLLDFIPFSECKKITCRYDNRYKEMAKATTNRAVKKEFDNILEQQQYKRLNDLHLYPEFHSSDINIEDFYIKIFLEQHDYTENNFGLDICSFDIEVDSSDWIGFPDENIAPCPVNMISYFNMKTNELYLFALKYDTETFEDFFKKHLKSSCMFILKLYKEHFGNFKIKPCFFNDELSLITAFFKKVNDDRPDYVAAWNARFDNLTLYNRLKKLLAGSDTFPEDIMCPEDFPEKKVYIKLDSSKEAEQDYSARFDNFKIYGYSNWIDMMCLYANITKPKGKKESYALDDIGEEETKMTKLDLSEEGLNIKTAHLENYSKFFQYSGVDSLLLALIIKKTGFIDLLHNIVMMTRTRPNKALKKTVCLRNFAEYFYNKNGMSISNNHSYLFPQEGSIEGAFVARPELIEKLGFINGIPSNKIFDDVIDMDLSRLYPSIIEAFNIAMATMKYKIKFTEVGAIGDEKSQIVGPINKTKTFMEHYISDDEINYCHDYHNLPDIEEMYKLVGERLAS